MNKTKNTTRIIVGNALLIALTIVFTVISNHIKIGSINVNLSLVTIALAAMLYGWKSGLLIGLVNGLIIIFAPDTLTYFFSINPVATIFLCLIKSGLAGIISAILFKLVSKKNEYFAVGISSIIIPIVNTSMFFLGVLLFFPKEFLVINLLTLINFGVELLISIFLTPAVYLILKTFNKKNK